MNGFNFLRSADGMSARSSFLSIIALCLTALCAAPASAQVGGGGSSGGTFPDCNGNGIDDQRDIANGTSEDLNDNGVPDECEAQQATWGPGAGPSRVLQSFRSYQVVPPSLAQPQGHVVVLDQILLERGEQLIVVERRRALTHEERLLLQYGG